MRAADPIQHWLSTEAVKWATPQTREQINRMYNHRQRVKSLSADDKTK